MVFYIQDWEYSGVNKNDIPGDESIRCLFMFEIFSRVMALA